MVSDVYFPRVNGVSTSIQTFRTELQNLGHTVSLVAPDYGRQADSGTEPDAGLIRVPSRTVLFDPEDRLMRGRSLKALLATLENSAIDVVHIQTPFRAHYFGVQLGRLLNAPTVATYHTFFEEYLFHYMPLVPKSIMRYLARHFSRSQCQQLDQLLVPSSAMRQVLLDYGITTPMQVLPTGIKADEFRTGDGARFRKRHGIAADRPILLTVGRVAFEKNIDFLLAMLEPVRQQIPAVLLVIAGEGPMLPSLRRQVRRLGLADNVLFVGYLDRQTELPDCYRAADLFVFASRTETQGLVLLEAMAAGVPVVSTAVMGTRDVLQERAGCLIAPDAAAGFAQRVLTVLTDPELHTELACSARSYVSQWTAATYARRLADLYQQWCGTTTLHAGTASMRKAS